LVGLQATEEWGILDALPVQEDLVQQIRERERIEQDLRVARGIQQASLPKEVPQLEGWHISPLYRPAREVGGDFYDFHLLSEGRLGVVVGDATGKGVPAALVMPTTCGMLQLAAQALDSSSPSEVLARVNETLLARITSNMFVTCFYAILDPESGSLTYSNAGHDLPYVRRSDGEAQELRARGMPLGLMPGMSYEQKEVVLDGGEAALFYSDGLVEAHDPKGEMFGFPRLRALRRGARC
jgi:serine phosphatase RsbU (regulator of sigma subunit)